MARGASSGSPDRLTIDRVLGQLGKVRAEKRVAAALDSAAEMTAVLNEHRQVVYANRALLEYADRADPASLCGQLPGEILGCVHAGLAPAGCGTTEECALCGAAEAVLETQRTGKAATTECHLDVSSNGRRGFLDMQVHTTPFEIEGGRFTLLSLVDIGDQKRRAALERVFLHDILNTASGLKAYLDLLKATASDPQSSGIVARLEAICATLVEEIVGQKVLISAENRSLTVRRELVESLALVQELVEQFDGQDLAHGRSILVAPFSEGATVVSDDVLVKRVLGNMLKNALEASPEGSTVTVGCERLAGAAPGVRFTVHNATVMPPEVQRKIFRRYFSTKGPDRGLGTYGMRLLGEEYLGGRVTFRSSERGGTVFSLLLPENPPGFGRSLREP
jgi:signal transduction histidine kinase